MVQEDITKGRDVAVGHYKCVKWRDGAEAVHYKMEGWCTIRTCPNCVRDCIEIILYVQCFFFYVLYSYLPNASLEVDV